MSTGRRANARRRLPIKVWPLPSMARPGSPKHSENTRVSNAVSRSGGASLLLVDMSTPAMFADSSASTGTTVASNPFTPPNKSLIAVLFANGASGASGASGSGCVDSDLALTFTKVVSVEDASAGACSIWLAQCPVSPGELTVQMTFPSAAEEGHYILPVVLTGASVANPGSWPGATATADNSSAKACAMGALVPNFNGSLMLGIFEHFGVVTAPTLLPATSDTLNGVAQTASNSTAASRCFAAQYTGTVRARNTIHNAFGDSAPSSVNTACAIEIPKVS